MSVANAALGIAPAITVNRTEAMEGPSLRASLSSAFLGTESAQYGDAPAYGVSVLHDALAESSGQSAYAENAEGAADFVRRFSLPARGINWGALHAHNAVDVAGACGSGVYAAAAGQVSEVETGWARGYGNYADIDHGNGVVTRYAHAESILVKVGQMVASGDMVARMGSTGNSTGCHVHFEVMGRNAVRNPFAAD